MTSYKLFLLPGDGIGAEVAAEVEKLIAWFNAQGIAKFETERGLDAVEDIAVMHSLTGMASGEPLEGLASSPYANGYTHDHGRDRDREHKRPHSESHN